MNKIKNIAIIGCGWAGARHAYAYRNRDIHIKWMVDTDIKRAEKLSKIQSDAHITNNYREAINDKEVDAVDICLPHFLHHAVAIESAFKEKHILCEKPIANSLDNANRMIEAAERNNIVLMVAENEIFSPLYIEVRELLRKSVIGKPALVHLNRGCYLEKSFIKDRPWFLKSNQAAGGMMMSGGIHDFEKLRMIIGEIIQVFSMRAPQRISQMEGDDTSVALLKFKNNAIGIMIQSYIMKNALTASGTELHTLRIDGEYGSIVAAGTHGGTIRIYSDRKNIKDNEKYVEEEIIIPEKDTFQLEIDHFLKCILEDIEPVTSGKRMKKSLKLVMAAYESIATGMPVKIPYDET